jgi:hypothetical protein
MLFFPTDVFAHLIPYLDGSHGSSDQILGVSPLSKNKTPCCPLLCLLPWPCTYLIMCVSPLSLLMADIIRKSVCLLPSLYPPCPSQTLLIHYNLSLSLSFFFFFKWDWGLNSRHCDPKANALSLEPHLQSILLWLFWRWGLVNYFAWVGLKTQSS